MHPFCFFEDLMPWFPLVHQKKYEITLSDFDALVSFGTPKNKRRIEEEERRKLGRVEG